MKSNIFVLLFLSIPFVSKSQTVERNLKLVGFNSYDTSAYVPDTMRPYRRFTVPQNRIWKIDVYTYKELTNFYINNGKSYGDDNPSSGMSLVAQSIWLKEGDVISFVGDSYRLNYRFSYFEYVLE